MRKGVQESRGFALNLLKHTGRGNGYILLEWYPTKPAGGPGSRL